MSTSDADAPHGSTAKVVTLLAVAWAAFGVTGQVIFSAAIAPSLGEELLFTIPGRGPTLAVTADTGVLSVVGLVVTVVALLIAVATVFLAGHSTRIAYAIGVVVCIVIPGFFCLNLANGLFALASGDGTSVDGSFLVAFIAVFGIAAGGISVAEAPKIARRTSRPIAT